MNRSKLREGLARLQRRPTWKRARYARIWMAANRSAVRAGGTRSAQMKRPETRGGLARLFRWARQQSRDRPRLVAGQHPKYALLRGSFVPNEPLQIRGGLARLQRRPTWKRARYVRIWMAANLSAVRAGGTGWDQLKRPKMRGGLARFRTGARPQSRDRPPVGGGSTCETSALETLVGSQ